MHLFHVIEDGFVDHWVTATSEDAAIEYVRKVADSEVELEAFQWPDEKSFSVTLVDFSCNAEGSGCAVLASAARLLRGPVGTLPGRERNVSGVGSAQCGPYLRFL